MKARKFLILVVVFVATLFAGWNLGKKSKKSDEAIRETLLSSRQIRTHTDGNSIQEIRSKRSEQDRIRAAMAMAQALPSSEISTWIRRNKFALQGSYAQTVFRNILLERWSQEDPVAFLSWIGEVGAREISFNLADMFKNHPEAADEALSKAKNPDEQSRIFALLAHNDPDQALSALRKILPIEVSRNPNFLISFNSLVEKRPTEMEVLLNELPPDHAGPLAIAVFKHKLEENFDGALNQLFDRPNGLKLLFARNFGAASLDPQKLLTRIPDFPDHWRAKLMREPWAFCQALQKHEGAVSLDWEGLGFSQTQAKSLRPTMLRNLAGSKTEEVMQELARHDYSERDQIEILDRIRYASLKPERASALSQHLKSDELRQHFLKNLEEFQPLTGTKILTPKEFLSDLSEAKGQDLGILHRTWKPEQKEAFSQGFQSLETTEKSSLSKLILEADRGWSRELKEVAILHLLESDEPAGNRTGSNSLDAIVSRHAHSLMMMDSQQAARWVSDLPESPTRLQTKINLARNWKNLDPTAAQKWIASQPKSERAAIEEQLDR